MEADGDPAPLQVLHKPLEDRPLGPSPQNMPGIGLQKLRILPPALPPPQEEVTWAGGGGPANPSDFWEKENSWSLCVVMGRWSEAGSFSWGLAVSPAVELAPC